MRTVKAMIWLREDIYEQVEAMDGVYDMDWMDVMDDE